MSVSYPSFLPCPQISDYRGTIDYLIGEVKFTGGNTRRRYKTDTRIEKYDLSFVYTIEQLGIFQAWANAYGFDWHWMPLVTHYSGFVSESRPVPHRVRIISDLAITALTQKHFRVKLSIELDPTSIPTDIIIPSGNWIIAQTPSSPSAPTWFVSNLPPAGGFIVAGRPATPAA